MTRCCEQAGRGCCWGSELPGAGGRPPLAQSSGHSPPPSMLPQGAGLQSRLGLMEYAGESERGHSRGSTGEGGGRSFRGTGVRGQDGGKA